MKLSLVLVSKTILQLLLFFLFLAFFGLPSFSQYQKKETIIVKSELDTQGIEAPAVTLQAIQNKFGWKSAGNELWYNFELYEHCERINMTIEQCIQNDSIKLTDFLEDIRIDKNYDSRSATPLLLNLSTSSAYWREDMTATAFGKYFTFNSPKSITLNQDYCMTFILVHLNANQKRKILIKLNQCNLGVITCINNFDCARISIGLFILYLDSRPSH